MFGYLWKLKTVVFTLKWEWEYNNMYNRAGVMTFYLLNYACKANLIGDCKAKRSIVSKSVIFLCWLFKKFSNNFLGFFIQLFTKFNSFLLKNYSENLEKLWWTKCIPLTAGLEHALDDEGSYNMSVWFSQKFESWQWKRVLVSQHSSLDERL